MCDKSSGDSFKRREKQHRAGEVFTFLAKSQVASMRRTTGDRACVLFATETQAGLALPGIKLKSLVTSNHEQTHKRPILVFSFWQLFEPLTEIRFNRELSYKFASFLKFSSCFSLLWLLFVRVNPVNSNSIIQLLFLPCLFSYSPWNYDRCFCTWRR